MNLYLIEQPHDAIDDRWSHFDGAVVIASDEERARRIYPDEFGAWDGPDHLWCAPEQVRVTFLAACASSDVKEGVVLASFQTR